jgi:uncharacterized protein YjdB
MRITSTIILACASAALLACDSTAPTATGIGAAGGTAKSSDGNATVVIPAGALSSNTNVMIAPATNPPPNAALISASAFEFGPTGTSFTTPVTMTIKYDPANIPANVAESSLQLYTYAGSAWVLVPGSSVDVAAHIVTGSSSHFSQYAPMGVVVVPVATVTVSPASGNLIVGSTVQLIAQAQDASHAPLSGRAVTWTTSDPARATVSTLGLVTGVAVGSVTITATSEGKSGTAAVNVILTPVASVAITPATSSIGVGATSALTVTTKDAGGNTLTGRTVTWASSDAGKATVSAGGVVTGVAAGSATITATSEGISATSAVTVTAAPPASGSVQLLAITTGNNHACGLNSAGAAYCWGSNGNGAIGDGTKTDRLTPVAATGGLTFSSIGADINLTCGITAGGSLYCWGGGAQLGEHVTPTQLSAGTTFTSVSVNWNHTCAVASDGTGYCVGDNTYGALGSGQSQSALPASTTMVPVAGGFHWKQIAATKWSACGITTDGALYCWGNIAAYNSGAGAVSQSSAPTLISNAVTFASLTQRVGTTIACGLTALGEAYCVGAGASEFGRAGGVSDQTPQRVGGSVTFKSLSHASDDLCGVATSNALYCWGSDGYGQLGQGASGAASTVPLVVMAGTSFSAVDLNTQGTVCAVASTGAGFCWGYNFTGQIGDGSTTNRGAPTPIGGSLVFRVP